MFRFFFVILFSLGIAGGVAYSMGYLDEYIQPGKVATPHTERKVTIDVGELLYEAKPLPGLPMARPQSSRQLVIEPCHVVIRDKQDVSSQKDGHLLFIGREIHANQGQAPIPGQPVFFADIFDGKKKVRINYQPWEDGQVVEYDEVVAKLEPAVAIHEAASKAAKIKYAEADYEASKGIGKEAAAKLARLNQQRSGPNGKSIVTDEEMGAAEATLEKYKGEILQKWEAINMAILEKLQTDIILSQHDLRCKLPGKSIVKKIYKANGEGVKALEPVMQLHNISRLRVEGAVDSQHFNSLQIDRNARCYLEPSVEMAPVPEEMMQAHRAEVTSVSVCADGRHFVSGSEDSTICVWEVGMLTPASTRHHKSAVRIVVCSPNEPAVLVGCADGTILRWDLTDPTKPPEPLIFKDQHRGAVTALAVSPDGNWVASGGEDNTIMLWNAKTGDVKYPFDAEHGVDDPHQGTITALYFTPQCKLISAARDNSLRVWELHEKGAKSAIQPIANRGGTVNQLGVSADGLFMLFDKGKTLQLVNTADGSTICGMENLAGANPFDTLALFSPDRSMMLTGGAGEGRLHLWRTPTPSDRAYQLRELVTKDKSPITSAAFGPAGRGFAVTGSKGGYVHLWQLPSEATVNDQLIGKNGKDQVLRLDLIEHEQTGGKTRIASNVVNPQYRLRPGQRVTLVVELPPVGK